MPRRVSTASGGDDDDGHRGEFIAVVHEVLDRLYEIEPKWRNPGSLIGRALRRKAAEVSESRNPPRTVEQARRLILVWLPVVGEALQEVVAEWEESDSASDKDLDALQIAVIEVNFGENAPKAKEEARAFILKRKQSRRIDQEREDARQQHQADELAGGSQLPQPPRDEEDHDESEFDDDADAEAQIIELTLAGLAVARGPYVDAWRAIGKLQAAKDKDQLRAVVGLVVRPIIVAMQVILDEQKGSAYAAAKNTRHRNKEFDKLVRPVVVGNGMRLSEVAILIRAIAVDVWPFIPFVYPPWQAAWARTKKVAEGYVRWVTEEAGKKTRRNGGMTDDEFQRCLPLWRDLATLWVVGTPGIPGVVDVGILSVAQLVEIKSTTKKRTTADDPRVKVHLDKVADFVRYGKRAGLQGASGSE